ncbi:MAG: ABC transporter substrate-binding protein [Methanomassiliicoccaceae archaeon]|nr:ABC transporter substrate-binding protein [Methanomassiliicoccaceae archaeon]
MNNKTIIAVLAVAAIVVVAGAAIIVTTGDDNKSGGGPVTVVDTLGREVTITSTDRIISSGVVPTAILCGLGLSSNIVGVSIDTGIYDEDPYVIGLTDDDFPKAITDGISSGRIAALGPMYLMPAETLASVPSDLVICQSTNEEIRIALDALGITYIVIQTPGSMKEVYDTIELVGKAVDREQPAEKMISEMKSAIKKITDWCESIVTDEMKGEKYRVALMISATYANGRNSAPGNILTDLCADNAFESVDRTALVSTESIASVNPDIIIYTGLEIYDLVVPAEFIESLYADPIIGNTGAAKNELIFALSGGARSPTAFYEQGIVGAYAIYAMFIYKDHLTFDITNVFDSSNYVEYSKLFWEQINA